MHLTAGHLPQTEPQAQHWEFIASPVYYPLGVPVADQHHYPPLPMPRSSVSAFTLPLPSPPTYCHISLWNLSTSSISPLSSWFRAPSFLTQPVTENLGYYVHSSPSDLL